MSKISKDTTFTIMNVGEVALNQTAQEVADYVNSLTVQQHASLCIVRDSDDKIIKDHSVFTKRQ